MNSPWNDHAGNPPHEPGCLGNHLGDCAVSGMFDRPEVMILRRYSFGETAAAYAFGSIRILADCGHETWIAPSGVVFLSRHPKILTVCTDCMPTGELEVAVAPGTAEELAARFGVARADQLIAEVAERGRRGRLRKGWG